MKTVAAGLDGLGSPDRSSAGEPGDLQGYQEEIGLIGMMFETERNCKSWLVVWSVRSVWICVERVERCVRSGIVIDMKTSD